MLNDTICAIITGIGPSAVSIVRISGNNALDLANKVLHKKIDLNNVDSHRVIYSKVVDNFNQKTIDEGLFLVMKGPNSFTGEDTVEIQVHGSIISVNYLLEVLVKNGARIAEPGEFTKRAFINGKLDLTQAEGIIDVIESTNRENLGMAVNSMGGKTHSEINDIISDLSELIAYLEASIDFPEDDVPSLSFEEKNKKISKIINALREYLENYNNTKYIKEGINVLILGRPNVGKSSLLNLILNKERAIVSNIPGTTRDIIEEYTSINSIPVKIIDTAGLRETDDIIEKIGVDKAKEYIKEADLILYMINAEDDLELDNKEFVDIMKTKKNILILNKIDMVDNERLNSFKEKLKDFNHTFISVSENIGIDELKNKIKNMFVSSDFDINSSHVVVNARQIGLIEKALNYMEDVYKSLNNDLQDDFLTIDLYDSKECLDLVVGNDVSDNVLDEIFSRFCIGK